MIFGVKNIDLKVEKLKVAGVKVCLGLDRPE